jgi:hypothetical protein
MDTVGNAPFLCDGITSFDQSNPDWSLDGLLELGGERLELIDMAS